MGLFDKIKTEAVKTVSQNLPPIPGKQEPINIKVASWTKEHKAGIQQLRKIDSDWYLKDEDIMERLKGTSKENRTYKYKYKTYSVMLIPEPNNRVDKNAIRVLFDGSFVGYIPSEQTTQMKKYINRSESLKGIIKGGPVRYVTADYVEDRCYDVEVIIQSK